MDRKTMSRIETELLAHLEYCFHGLGRSERRDALASYARGLMLDGERKSLEPMAQRLAPEGKAQAYRQRMQEAVCVADWDPAIVFRRVGELANRQLAVVDAWALDDTGFPKKGHMSVGVQRQYSGTMGRIDNCQVAASLHLASEEAGVCIGMRLYLPEKWLEPRYRDRGKIPESIDFKQKWRIGLDLIDEAISWGISPRPIVADAGYGESSEFRSELRGRGLSYVVGVSKTLSVWPPGTEFVVPETPTGRMGRPRSRAIPVGEVAPMSIDDIADLPGTRFRKVTWREGTRGPQAGRFAFVRVRTAHKHKSAAAPGAEETLIIEWPESADKPTTFYLSNLPTSTSHRRLVYLAKVRWRIEQDYQEMKGELGLDHFEGRSWRGFHHHVACVAVAFAFLALNRALFPPRPGKDEPSKVPSGSPARHHPADRPMSPMPAMSSAAPPTDIAHLIR